MGRKRTLVFELNVEEQHQIARYFLVVHLIFAFASALVRFRDVPKVG